MINKIKELSNQSKYTMWYCGIITKALERTTRVEGERHHIVPKSMWNDGAKLKENIVLLTYREHFLCHKLLLNMVVDSIHKSKMAHALWRLSHKRKQDGIKLFSRDYAIARKAHSESISMLWKDKDYRTKTLKSREWFYNNEEQIESNRQKALTEMKDAGRKAKFVQAGLGAAKAKRDEDTKAWVVNSMGSESGMAKAKAKSQSEANRELCRQRELAKPKEDRTTFAKSGQQALVEKLGGEEAYRTYLSERIKGRKKYINTSTNEIKIAHTQPGGFISWEEYKVR